ncbi:uncharacterized protein TNCV_680881 [Trichonephila clavipes]|nr:uncharacterized protein TNCV_680881 [Trichonephila clavipes]
MEFYFVTKSHCHVINGFQQKLPGETAPNASTITHLLRQFHGTGSVADRKQSCGASLVKPKVADVETALQRSQIKRPSVYINIITEIISLLNIDKRYAWLQQDTATCHTSRDSVEFLTEFCDNCVVTLATTFSGRQFKIFFLWGYLENVAFKNNTQTLDELKCNILHAISDINSHSLRKVTFNLVKRI